MEFGLDKNTVEEITVERARDMAPVVQYQTEDGPMFGVHPSVDGLEVLCYTKEGEVYYLETSNETFPSDSPIHWAQATALKGRIEIWLSLGNHLDMNRWRYVRSVYGTPAWEREFDERMESHVNAGGSIPEFLANN